MKFKTLLKTFVAAAVMTAAQATTAMADTVSRTSTIYQRSVANEQGITEWNAANDIKTGEWSSSPTIDPNYGLGFTTSAKATYTTSRTFNNISSSAILTYDIEWYSAPNEYSTDNYTQLILGNFLNLTSYQSNLSSKMVSGSTEKKFTITSKKSAYLLKVHCVVNTITKKMTALSVKKIEGEEEIVVLQLSDLEVAELALTSPTFSTINLIARASGSTRTGQSRIKSIKIQQEVFPDFTEKTFGEDAVVSDATTWNFNGLTETTYGSGSAAFSALFNGNVEYNNMYVSGYSSNNRGYHGNNCNTTVTFGDGEETNLTRYMYCTNDGLGKASTLTSTTTASTKLCNSVSMNASKPGYFRAFVSANASDATPKFYLYFNGEKVDSISVTGTTPQEISYLGWSAGTYYLHSNSAHRIYAVRYTPYQPTVTISASKFATYSNAYYALDFANAQAGLDAYAVKANGSTLSFNKITGAVPANTGVLLNAAEGTYSIPVVASAEALAENDLVSTNTTLDTDAKDYYALTKLSETVGFAKASGEVLTSPLANKAYLAVAKSVSNARSFVINFDNEATGISEASLSTLPSTLSTIYDLQGRRVSTLRKGMYIMGNKKVLVGNK